MFTPCRGNSGLTTHATAGIQGSPILEERPTRTLLSFCLLPFPVLQAAKCRLTLLAGRPIERNETPPLIVNHCLIQRPSRLFSAQKFFFLFRHSSNVDPRTTALHHHSVLRLVALRPHLPKTLPPKLDFQLPCLGLLALRKPIQLGAIWAQ
ncbi:unnamed protein product [Protopolystoma xenopodis]|uniref:Uncharacterized protein n=1 Tax=Protopolystoma xenopodis TaxID=117903 RepID=A0A3S4ZAP0_9PLAT|nr:unnamed protein product [Protopolystoma xenopodis]